MKLAEHYGDKPPNELPMLFQRILSNCTLDWFRRQKTRRALFSNMSDFEPSDEDGEFDLLETFRGRRRTPGKAESAEDTTRRAQILREIEERDRRLAGPSTRSLSDALLGRNGRRRDGRCHGLLRRQRQDPLFARRPRPEQGTQGQGNFAMNDYAFDHLRRGRGRNSAAGWPPGSRPARLELPHDIGRAPARRARAGAGAPQGGAAAANGARRGVRRRRHRGARRRLVDAHRLRRAAGRAGGRPRRHQHDRRTTTAPANWPKSMPPC